LPIEVVDPPKVHQIRHTYTPFLDRVREEAGKWVSIPLDEIGGSKASIKQTTVLTCAKSRGFRVQTTVQNGRIYARFLGNIEARVLPVEGAQ
jgi:hypothetical protein